MSDVPEGYKMSEVGVIPEEWVVKRLGDAVDVVMGQSPVGTSYNRNGTGAPLINGPTEFTEKYPVKIQWTSQPTKFCKKGDVLLCVRGSSTGRINISDDEYCIGRGVAAIRAKSCADTSFITFQVDSAVKSILALTTGSTFPNIDGKSIRAIQFPFPPLPEQQAIASALSDVDALITALEQFITKKRSIKQGAMQQLLTGEKRLPGFSGKWEVKKLGEIADIDPDNLSNSTEPEYSFHYISLEDVDCGTLRNTTELLFKNAPSRARRKIRNEDILLSTVRPNLKSHLLLKKEISNWICSTGFSVVRCRNNMAQSGFVFNHLFSSVIDRQIETLTIGSNYPAINSKDVKSLLIPLPPTIEEQQAIAQVLSDR